MPALFYTDQNITFAKFAFSLRQHELNDIISACKTNNSIAQERLYKHYFALMYSICKSYSENQQTIISLVNEGFLKIFMNINSFDTNKGNFEGWAKKIVTNTAIDYARSAKNKSNFLQLENEEPLHNALSEKPTRHIEEEVLFLIKKMPPVTQQVFSMHVFKGYSHREIAEILNIAESTSRWHVSEARKNLKQQAHKIF
ncbi:sigma-70 family RNA polymerase sigma factor [Hanamia caeni]|uniref:Sigma-70 family RNA polymerase sigma factor n=1 Tax=Hanamia caeni TaxID=2294116 RepID=A0A3M9NEA9_9BACT|nr:sigma-70 family RNA polymerase sigma factor [Hanamia caeni]